MKKIGLFIVMACVLFLFCAPPKAAESNLPVYHCYKTAGPIEIDGKITESAWDNAEEAEFVMNDGSEVIYGTTFKWMWDDLYLYGAFHVVDDDIWSTMTEYDAHLWEEEVVEFFIDADSAPKTYFEFEINPLNAILDLYLLNKYTDRRDIYQLWKWDCKGMKSAVSVKGTVDNREDKDEYWDFEVAIPFEQIYTAPNVPPKPGDTWKIDFCRGERRGEEFIASSWSPPAFHNPLSYGTIIFEDKK